MYAGETKRHLSHLLSSSSAPSIMLWGPPGVGKSSIVKQICQEKSWGFIDLRLLLLNPIDLRGIPYPNRKTYKTDWLPPSFLPDTSRDGTEGVLLYDEITLAPTAVQAAAYQIILDRAVGEYKLPVGWRQVAAGNRTLDKSLGSRMPASLANRMIHIEIETHIDDWKEWALSNGIDHSVVSFLSFRPELLYQFPHNAAEIKAFPSPRTWEFVSSILMLFDNPDDAFASIQGSVGEGPALEFIAFMKMLRALPNPDAVLDGMETAVPEQPDMICAMIGALISRLVSQKTTKQVGHFFSYVSKLPVEYQVLAINDSAIAGLRGSLVALPEFKNWVANNTALLSGVS